MGIPQQWNAVWQKLICIGHHPLTLSISQSTDTNGQYGSVVTRSCQISTTSWLKIFVANQSSPNGFNLGWNTEPRQENPSSPLPSLTLQMNQISALLGNKPKAIYADLFAKHQSINWPQGGICTVWASGHRINAHDASTLTRLPSMSSNAFVPLVEPISESQLLPSPWIWSN